MTEKEKYNIRQELESLAPTLSKIKVPVRNDLPEGYFEEVEELIMRQINICTHPQEEWDVPEDYFTNLDSCIDRIIQKEFSGNIPSKGKVHHSNFVRYLVAASLTLLLVFTGYQLIHWSDSTEQSYTAFEHIEDSEYIQYLEQNSEDIELNTLIESNLIEESDLMVVDVVLLNEEPSFIFNSTLDF